MGEVYEAKQLGFNGFQKKVAIKTLLEEHAKNDLFIEMFIQEAKLAATLIHENIIQIYQLGYTNEGYYIVMEYVEGVSLHGLLEHLKRFKKEMLPTNLAVFLCSKIARALAYAHSREDDFGRLLNVIHRDVCPNNIMITVEGQPKLADFGIARAQNIGSIMDKSTSKIFGKLPYMSPSQAKMKELDFHADIFGLGAVLFECLSGEPIRKVDSLETLLKMAENGEVDWSLLPEDLKPEIKNLLKNMLSDKKVYPDIDSLAQELEMYIYRDGYGPTIKSMQKYLQKEMSILYNRNKMAESSTIRKPTEMKKIQNMATLIIDQ